jgi:hypothetical protein
MTDDAKNPVGRPSLYSAEIAHQACELVAQGMFITDAAKQLGFAPCTFYEWRDKYPEFASRLARAEDQGFDALADRLVSAPDDYEDVQRARLYSDNVKWILARRSKRYADRMDLSISQVIDIGSALADARARALRPVCDQPEQAEAQVVDYVDVSPTGPADEQSNAQLPAPAPARSSLTARAIQAAAAPAKKPKRGRKPRGAP